MSESNGAGQAMGVAMSETEKELLDTLADVIEQACWDPSGQCLDSMALTLYADGMRVLARYGRLTITSEFGRRVIGTLVEED